ncbi:MAG: UDP-N-acetylmuramoyl-L-alanine--D-glutamate ligase [Porticoccaceae bacterium]|nr:UDP-N-acetylmuramoyl-L-alanine--D-glutamate ligase [Porticoccaceae bacterium]
MNDVIATNRLTAVVGIGTTGLAVARFLARRGEPFVMMDTRVDPPGLAQLARELPTVPVELGGLDEETLRSAQRIVVSPGLSLEHPALISAADAGVAITGDIQLFADQALAPIVAITGSNGKSTVTTLVGKMAEAAGLNVGVGGNLGTPALDLLDDRRDLYVLELSSFQLELVDNLNATVATVLNMSPDHMDRYSGIVSYHRAKHRIFRGVKQVVSNRQDALSQPLVPAFVTQWSFGLDTPDFKGFGVAPHNGEDCLCFQDQPLLRVSELVIKGRHNLANALAALALGHAVGLPFEAMAAVLKTFRGLPHRCESVAWMQGVSWINDSKATNVGAAVAAIEGLAGDSADIILIAGGQGKGQDFSDLAKAAAGRVRLAILIGEDAPLLADKLAAVVDVVYATSITAAVNAAAEAAVSGDKVLLSPACASFDMFRNFEDRGDKFATAVRGLA